MSISSIPLDQLVASGPGSDLLSADHITGKINRISELAVKEPDLMGLVLQAAVAALVNVQSVTTIDMELKRRAVKGN